MERFKDDSMGKAALGFSGPIAVSQAVLQIPFAITQRGQDQGVRFVEAPWAAPLGALNRPDTTQTTHLVPTFPPKNGTPDLFCHPAMYTILEDISQGVISDTDFAAP